MNVLPLHFGLRSASQSRRRGFTLLELLIVIAVIGILVALLLPAIQASRESARRLQCTRNISQMIIAVQSYELSHRAFPYGTIDSAKAIDNRPIGYHHGWITQVLSEVEQRNAFRAIDRRQSVYHARNVPVRTLPLPIVRCPSGFAMGSAHSNYAGVHHSIETPIAATNNGAFILNTAIRRKDVQDGLSQTLFLGEKQIDGGTDLGWMSGTRATLRNLGGGINAIGLPGGGGATPVNTPESLMGPEIANNAWGLPGLPGNAEAIIQRHTNGVADYDVNPAPGAVNEDAMMGSTIGDGGFTPDGFATEPPSATRGKRPQMFVGGFGSNHPGGALFAFGDGHVKLIRETTSVSTLGQLADRADGKLLREGR